MTKPAPSLCCCALLILSACAARRPVVEDVSGKQDLSLFKVQSLRGVRDGDRISAQALISDSSSILTMDMHFAVGSPTTLQSGTWQWTRNGEMSNGQVSARSVTFLGGQDGPPSVGGSFDLLGPEGTARYRVNVPVTELNRSQN